MVLENNEIIGVFKDNSGQSGLDNSQFSELVKESVSNAGEINLSQTAVKPNIENGAEIQLILDMLASDGGGNVIMPLIPPYVGQSYITDTTITIPAGVTLNIMAGVTLECRTNNNAIEIAPQGYVNGGGTIYMSLAMNTSACISLDADLHVYGRSGRVTGADNLYLKNAGVQGLSWHGQGIHLKATTNNSFVEWTSFNNINITDASTSILLTCAENRGDLAFINGNNFNNIFMDNFEYGIKTIFSGTGSPSITRNSFNTFNMQTGPETIRCILDGGAGNNYNSLTVWDFVNTTAIEITGSDAFIQVSGVTADKIILNSKNNKIISILLPQLLTRFNQAALPIASEWEGGLLYLPTNRCIAYSTGNEWNYYGAQFERPFTVNHSIGVSGMGAGITYTNLGAIGTVRFTLPNAASIAGKEVVIRRDASQSVEVAPNALDVIGSGTLGTTLTLDSDNAFIHIKNYAPNLWTIVAQNGIITNA